MKLNIGSGVPGIDGYVNLDRATGQEAYPLPYDDNTADEIRASHILEHFGYTEVPPVVSEWFRVLKPGGIIKVAVPDFDKIKEKRDPMWPLYLFGGQIDNNDFHKSVFTREVLTDCLIKAGFCDITSWESDGLDSSCLPVSLNLQAKKPQGDTPTEQAATPQEIKIDPRTLQACISMPRLTFTGNMSCALRACADLAIRFNAHTGAYWGQCLERCVMQVLEESDPKPQYIITMDYDTVFDSKVLAHLLALIVSNPHADCIAPIQIRREGDVPMIWAEDDDGKVKRDFDLSEFDPPLTKLKHAHFGLTVFKASAFEGLPHPWFLSVPNKDGEWGDGRLDADIYFWEHWAKHGHTLYLANHVPIGHIQQMVTWPTHKFGAVQQYISDFQTSGIPPEARK